jgi:hypothetical protein
MFKRQLPVILPSLPQAYLYHGDESAYSGSCQISKLYVLSTPLPQIPVRNKSGVSLHPAFHPSVSSGFVYKHSNVSAKGG